MKRLLAVLFIVLLVVFFHPLIAACLFLGGYAILFIGHFVFEKNVPLILKDPRAPFVAAVVVFSRIWQFLTSRRVRGSSEAPAAASPSHGVETLDSTATSPQLADRH